MILCVIEGAANDCAWGKLHKRLKIFPYYGIIVTEVMKMPAVSCYLNDDILNHIKAKAKAVNISVSGIIREAVKNYLETQEQKEARERVLKVLSEKKPLGGDQSWEDTHHERTAADVDRR